MEFKAWNGYTADEICILYTLAKVRNRHNFVRDMVNCGKIKFVGSTKMYEIMDEDLENYLNGVEVERKYEELDVIKQMMELFPEGRKRYGNGGASKTWRGNEMENRRKLDALFRMCGYTIDDDIIIEATRRYVDSFNGDYTLMRTLPYFILKRTIEDGEATYISDLLSAVEDLKSGKPQENRSYDWTSKIV